MISQVTIRPIFFDLEVDRVVKPGELEPSITQFAAYDPTRNGKEAYFSEFLDIEPHFQVKKELAKTPPGVIAQKFKDVWPQFVDWCAKARSVGCRIVLIAHNAWNHDQQILKTECARIGQALPRDWKVFDTLALANVALDRGIEKGLQALREYYKIPSTTAHVAKEDVDILYKVFCKMTEGIDINKVYEGMLDPHPVKAVAAMIKTHRAAMPIIRGLSANCHTEVCYYDTETTGLLMGPDPVRIVELSAFIPSRKGKDRFFTRLVNPEMRIPVGAQNVHHISDAMVADEPTIRSIWNQFVAWIRSSPNPNTRWVLVAHNNYNYDKKVLDLECDRIGTKVPSEWRFFDTFFLSMSLQKGLKRPQGFHKLQNLANFYQVKPHEAHRAMGDVMTMYEVMQKMMGNAPQDKVLDAMFEAHPILAVAEVIGRTQFFQPKIEQAAPIAKASPPEIEPKDEAEDEVVLTDDVEEEVILADVAEEEEEEVQHSPPAKRLRLKRKQIIVSD